MVYVFEIILVIYTRCIFNATLLTIDCPVQGQMLDFDDPLWGLSQFRICYDSTPFFFFFVFSFLHKIAMGKEKKMGLRFGPEILS